MKTPNSEKFNTFYDLHCKHLKLKGLQPATIDAYSRAIRRIGNYFDDPLDKFKVFLYSCVKKKLGRDPYNKTT